ncbi:MAG: hypothetical protein PUC23_03435 [bacterium]|nr:hypothetical protein [bacterium]
MKKIIICLMSMVMVISFAACGNYMNVNNQNACIVDGNEKIVVSYGDIESNFIIMLNEMGYDNISVYNTDDIPDRVLENRKGKNITIVERVIGKVTNLDKNGDGIILSTSDSTYNYISYRGLDFETNDETIILSYLVYNPDTNYTDDIVERYDFPLDREYED